MTDPVRPPSPTKTPGLAPGGTHSGSLIASTRVRLERLGARAWNLLFSSRAPQLPETDCGLLAAIQESAKRRTDISDHLALMFIESLAQQPSLIVELGVRSGESTRIFERVARLCGSVLVSVDLQDCSAVSGLEGWHFVQGDDVAFGETFGAWCVAKDVRPVVDVLFIDTSHELDHTIRELDVWLPHLAPDALVLLHDTNLTRWYRRRDGSVGLAWDNDRGVIHALERHLGVRLDESADFRTIAGGFIVEHHAECNGLTLLRSLPVRCEDDSGSSAPAGG